MRCLKPKPIDLLIVDIFVHVIILLGILLAFFVLIISKIEKKELTGQIKNQINTNLPLLYEELNKPTEIPCQKDGDCGGTLCNLKTKKCNGLFKTLIETLNKGEDKNPSILTIMSEYYDKPDNATETANTLPIVGALIVLLSLTGGLIAICSVLRYSCKKCIKPTSKNA